MASTTINLIEFNFRFLSYYIHIDIKLVNSASVVNPDPNLTVGNPSTKIVVTFKTHWRYRWPTEEPAALEIEAE